MSRKLCLIVITLQIAGLPSRWAKDEPRIGWKIYLYSQTVALTGMALFFHSVYFKERDKPNPTPWRDDEQ